MSLQVRELASGYGKIEVLHGVSLEPKKGTISCIIGPNGSGKSTLLKSIVGLVKPWRGTILCDGKDLAGLEPHQVLREGVSMLAQARSIFPYLKVSENLEMGAYSMREKQRTKVRLEEVYTRFPILKERQNQLAYTMSGGEQRILELARALMVDPKILLLDEPSAMLSPRYLEMIFRKIEEIKDLGVTCLVVEQNVRKALSIADYVFVLNLGLNAFEGTSENFLKSDQLVRLYLGG